MAGVRAVGAAGRGLGSSYAGSAGRRSCVRVGSRCSPPAVRGDPLARGVRGRALSLLRLPSSWGLPGPAVHVLWSRLCGCGGPALSPWPTCPVGAACRGGGWGPSPGGWPAAVVRGVWCQVLSLSRRPGSRDPCVPGVVGVCVGTLLLPHGVRPSGHLRRGAPMGRACRRCEGRLGSGTPPPPPTCCGRGCAGVGAQHCAGGLHAL